MLRWTAGSTGALAHVERCTLAVLLSFAALAAFALRAALAFAAAATVAASGLANALFQFSMLSDLWSTRYDVTLLVRVGAQVRGVPEDIPIFGQPRASVRSGVILATAVLVALPRP